MFFLETISCQDTPFFISTGLAIFVEKFSIRAHGYHHRQQAETPAQTSLHS
jgi:hypothetical protein